MIINDDERQILIKHRIEQAKNMINEIKFLIDNDLLATATNRIYYGMFYILNALALKNKYSTKKHQQLIGWFNKNYVHSKIIDKKYGKMLRKAFENRSESDYGEFVEFSKEEILDLFNGMKEFIDEIERLILKN